jgi:serine/threonine protein kinase
VFHQAQAVQAIDDGHLVPIIEAVDLENTLVVASAWMGGGSLRARLASGRLSVTQATSTVAHAAVGLDVAHSSGAVHGALSPAAILFDGDRAAVNWVASPRPIDPGYVAPEVRAGGAPSVAADIYALASIALACLTGADPPVEPGEAPIPDTVSVGTGLAWAIRLGRAADPSGRPPTAMMFAQMLKRASLMVRSG